MSSAHEILQILQRIIERQAFIVVLPQLVLLGDVSQQTCNIWDEVRHLRGGATGESRRCKGESRQDAEKRGEMKW